jgi:hypothetical protein
MSTSGSSLSALSILLRTLALKFAASEVFRISELAQDRGLSCSTDSVISKNACIFGIFGLEIWTLLNVRSICSNSIDSVCTVHAE